MKKPRTVDEPAKSEEVQQALEKTTTFSDALDQVFKKIVVAECLLMAALSHYDANTDVPSDRLQEWIKALSNDLLNAKRNLMSLKVAGKTKK